MIKYISQSLKNKQKNSNGFSLIELVVAVAVLMLITPTIAGVMQNATKYSDDLEQTSKNTIISSAFESVFRDDIQNATAVDAPSGNNNTTKALIRIAKKDGTCKVWALGSQTTVNGKTNAFVLKSKTMASGLPSSTPIASAEWANWSDMFNGSSGIEIKPGPSGKMFKYENGRVTYDLTVGKKDRTTNYSSTITPQVAPSAVNNCWQE